jgi:hypothetical protein
MQGFREGVLEDYRIGIGDFDSYFISFNYLSLSLFSVQAKIFVDSY